MEVIDLDVDEEEQQTTRNIVEITLDDNKDKYSSDKENEIIMVRDSDSDSSDDEEEEEGDENEWQPGSSLTKLNGVIRCEYCSKNFRNRHTLNMHILACQKSPAKALNLNKRKSEKDKENQNAKKEYTCKICQEKFDMVVALARHTRSAHSQKKKHKLSFSMAKYANQCFSTCFQFLYNSLVRSIVAPPRVFLWYALVIIYGYGPLYATNVSKHLTNRNKECYYLLID